VEQALAFAGGENSLASGADVLLERVYEHANRNVENINLDESKTEMMQGGDILSVRAVVDRFRNAVTLRGNVANPGRYSWKPGMRVSDLIPNRESLVTRDYWRRRNQQGQFVLEQSEQPNEDRSQRIFDSAVRRQEQMQQLQQLGATPGQAQLPGSLQQVPGAQQQLQQLQQQQQGGQQGAQGTGNPAQQQNLTQLFDSQGQPVLVQGGAIIASGVNAQQQNEGSLQLGGLTQQELQNGAASSASGGASAAAALTGGAGRFRARNDVVLSAPDIDWGYAVIERQDDKTLTTSLIPFNLGKIVLDGDASQDVQILPGDVVTIFSKSDIRVPSEQQTRYVRLEGEVNSAGVYSVQPGETLRGLLQRAGGLTPEAYLYASEFTRESTRKLQQQRLNEYADELEGQLTLASLNSAAVTPQETVSQAAAQTAIRATVDRLRRIRPIGRIVLNLKPNDTGIDSVPDIALEDGDRFIIPRVPSNITVEGQVYSSNAFLYKAGERAGVYLHQAGGPDRQADHKRMFILRADGSVVSQQYTDVRKSTIYPGDTIVIPPTLPSNSLVRTLAIAQIIGNLGLSAASIAILARQ
jgi:hypothetical protein